MQNHGIKMHCGCGAWCNVCSLSRMLEYLAGGCVLFTGKNVSSQGSTLLFITLNVLATAWNGKPYRLVMYWIYKFHDMFSCPEFRELTVAPCLRLLFPCSGSLTFVKHAFWWSWSLNLLEAWVTPTAKSGEANMLSSIAPEILVGSCFDALLLLFCEWRIVFILLH